jgi:hypothetical protein
MTALSSMASGKDSSMGTGKDTRMMAIAAVNTINAGLLALMHHSGLPHRYKNDWKEFDGVEIHVKELLESGLVKEGVSRDQAIETCFSMYRKAKERVVRNKRVTDAFSNVAASESTERLL